MSTPLPGSWIKHEEIKTLDDLKRVVRKNVVPSAHLTQRLRDNEALKAYKENTDEHDGE